MLLGIAQLFIFLYQTPKLAPAGANPPTSVVFDLSLRLLILEPQCLTCVLVFINNLTSCRNAKGFALIVFVLGSVLCFWYRFHYLPLKVQAVQDVIYLPNESRTYIKSSIKIYLHNPLDHLNNL